MLKKKSHISHLFIEVLTISALIVTLSATALSATRTASVTGNWSATATWGGAAVPTAADAVIINSGVTVTVDAAATCLSVTNNGILTFTTFGMTVAGPWINNGTVNVGTATVTFNSATAAINAGTGNANFYTIATATTATTLTINTPVTVAGSLTLNGTAVSNTITIAGSNSITVTGTTSIPRPTTSGVSTIAVGAGTLSTATLTLSGTTNGRNTVVTVSTGTVTVTGNFTGAGTINPGGSVFTFTGAGTLNVGGTGTNAIPQSTTAWTFTPSTGTVNFNGANQTVGANTFNNLTFSGSGAKTIPTGTTTVNGIFSIENGANANTFTGTLAYGANATLQYNTSSARAVSTEWITPFVATGGVIIGNTGTITLNAAKTIGNNTSVPLTINSGATLATGNYGLTFHGNFINNGTLNAGSSTVTLAGTTTTQSIDGFTTTGLVSMTKTAGTATFTENVNGGALTINGTGGTLNLGAALTHTFTGIVTLTTGTLNGGSSTLNENATSTTAWNGTGTVFTAGTGTVNFGAAGNQTIATATTFNNLTTSSSGTTTTGAAITVNGNLGIADGTAFTAAGFNLTVTGTTTVGGGTSGTLTISSATGTKTFTGLVTINSGATWNNTANEAITFQGGITNNGTFTAGTGVHTFNTNAQSLAGTLSIPSITVTGVTLTNNGTLTVGTALTGTGGLTNVGTLNINFTGTPGITTLTATANGNTVVYGYAGTQTVVSTNYYNLTLSGSNAKTLQTGTTSIGGTLTLSGTATTTGVIGLSIGGNVVLGSGTTFTSGAYTHNVAGNWTNNGGTFTATGSTIVFNGSNVQTIGGTTASTFNNVAINNASGVSLSAATSVAGTLTLTSGILSTTSTNVLTITNTSTNSIVGASSASYIVGSLALTMPATSSGMTYTFPIGDVGNYCPLSLVNVQTGTTGPVVQVTESATGASTSDGTTITSLSPNNWYVQTISGNFTSATIQITESGLIPTNVIGTSVAQAGTYSSIGGTNIGASVTSVQTITTLPVYLAIGISAIKPLYSYQSGNWDNTTTWTTDPSGTLWTNPRVPNNMDNVTILNGRSVAVSASGKQVVSLTMNAGGVLDIKSTTGHNFGTVTGQGKIMLSSNTFPGGTYTSFVANGGGTIEYYNLNNAPITTTQFIYNNLIVSDSSGSRSAYIYGSKTAPTNYTINGNFSLKNYSSGNDTLYFGNPSSSASDSLISMTVYGNFSVDAHCYIRVNNFASSHAIPNPTATPLQAYPVHTIYLYGNFTNNGSVRFTGLPSPVANSYYTLTTTNVGTNYYGDVQVYFYGASNNTVVCNDTTDFYRFIVAKGSDKTYTLEVSSNDTSYFGLYAPNNQGGNTFNGGPEGFGYGAYYKALFIHYGILKLDTNIILHSLTEGGQDFNLIPTAGLWVNGANVSTTLTGVNGTSYQAVTLYGSLRISAGSFSTGDAAGMVLGTLGTPSILVEGTGILDVSQLWASVGTNLISYMQTGGTTNFRAQGEYDTPGPMFALTSTYSSFIMSGGSINFTNNLYGATYDYQIMSIGCQTGYYNVTGGTINFNLPSSTTAFTVSSTAPLYNLNITRGSGTGNDTIVWQNSGSPLIVLNNLTIGSNTTLNLNNNLVSLSVGGNFTIASGGIYTPGTSDTTTFNGVGNQSFYNIGTITNSALYNLTIANSSITSIISNNLTVNGVLTINANATLNDSGKTITVLGNIVNSGTHAAYQTTGGIILSGTAAQTLSGNGAGIFKNVTLNKTGGSVTMAANMTITGNLNLASSSAGVWNILNIGTNNLALGANAMVYSDLVGGTTFNSNRMIQTSGLSSDGGITKTYSSTTAFNFPFGFYNTANTTYYYMPQSIQFSSAPTTYGTVTTRPVNARHPLLQSKNSLSCYWKTTSAGFSGVPSASVVNNYYYDYAASNYFVTGTETSYIPGVLSNSAWYTAASGVTVATNLVTYTVDNADGDFTAGIAAAFGSIPTLYSINGGGVWSTAGTWSTTRGGSPGTKTPTSSTLVYICTGTTVVTTAAADSSSSLTIEPGATLDLGTYNAHSFGTIVNNATTGSGTLRIARSGYFPTGDWGNFLGANGGTIEYYGTGTISLPSTYTLPSGSTANITNYCNLTTSPGNAANVILPNTNLTVYKNFTVGSSGTANGTTQINAGAASTTLEVHGLLSINQYGVLQFMNSTANIPQYVIADSDIVIAAGGALQVLNGGNSVANSLTVYGSITNNGTLDLDPNYPTNDTYYSTLQFAGSNSKVLTSSSTPVRTRLYNIIVNKGTTVDSIINVSMDTTGFQMGGGGLTLQNGTFRLTSPATIALSSASFTIPVTGCISSNGGTMNIVTGTTSADLILKGKLEVRAGTVNVGPSVYSSSTMSSSILYSAAGSPTINISGGMLNVFSQIRRDTANSSGSLNYSQTGGTVTIGEKYINTKRGAFEVLNSGSQFSMSGGKMIIAGGSTNASSPYDLNLVPDAAYVTGGTILFGLNNIAANKTKFYFQTSSSLWNLTLNDTINAAAVQEVYASTIQGNLTIGGTSSFYNANGLDLEIGGNLINNNSDASSGIANGGFQAQSLSQTTSFLGTNDQTITGTSSNRTNFANLEIATASAHTLFLSAAACTLIVNSDLTLTTGTFNDGGNAIYLLNDVNNNAIHVSSSTTAGGMVFIGTSNQGMTGSGSGIFGNIEINNSGHGVNMTDNSTINGQIKFTNGYLYIDDYALTLGLNAVFAGTQNASNLILLNGVLSDKGVTKIFPSNTTPLSFTYPIGANGKYTPCTYSFSTNSNSGATIKVIPVDGLQPTIDTTKNHDYLEYYWYVSSTGFTSSYVNTVTFTYATTDTVGNPANIERYDNSTAKWSTVTGTISPPTFTISSLLDGSYTIGDAFGSLPTLYSFMSGSWFNSALWYTDTTNKVAYNKIPSGNPVVIRAQDSVALSTNSASAASVVVNGVLDAMNTTFHSLGQVSGGGKIRIASTSSNMYAFPGGTFDAFLGTTGSTVEFYGTINGTLPLDQGNTTKPYQNVVFSGTSTKYISSKDMQVNGNLTIANGSKLDNTLYNKDIYLLGNWIDNNTTAAGFTAGAAAVRFSGSTPQAIMMSGSSMTETFYNFVINNTAGLTLQTGSANVSNQLILTSGNINTSSSDTLTITNTSTSAVSGGSNSSFVNGPLRKSIQSGSNFQFPVGDANSSGRKRIGFVAVNSTSTSGTQLWTAKFFDKNATADGYDVTKITSPLSSVIQNEYWSISGPSGGSANVVLTWDSLTGMNSSATKRALTRVAEWNTPTASTWNSVGAVVTDNGQYAGTVATSTLIGLDSHIFTIGAMSASLFTASQSGLWNSTTTWVGGGIPSLNDTVEIRAYTVTLNSNAAVAKLIIDTSGTFANSTNALSVSGNFIFNGTWTGTGGKISLTSSLDTVFGTGAANTSTGTCTLEIAGGTTVIAPAAALTMNMISILSGESLNNNGYLTVDSITGAASTSALNNVAGSTLVINGPLLTTGTLNASGCPNTVIYNGTIAQTINPTTYCYLQMKNAGTKTAANSFAVKNDFIVNPASNIWINSGVYMQVFGRTYTAGLINNSGNILVSN